MGWDQAKASAMGVLGSKAKIPEPKTNVSQMRAAFVKSNGEFVAAVDVMRDKMLAMQNNFSTMKNVFTQHENVIDSSDFGLDEDADKDKIVKARKILDDFINNWFQYADKEIKTLNELDKHAIALDKYKPTPAQ